MNQTQRYYAWSQACWVVAFIIALLIRGATFYHYAYLTSQRVQQRLLRTAVYLPFGFFMKSAAVGDVITTYSRCVDFADDLFPGEKGGSDRKSHILVIYLDLS
jgi:hypothetical protein